MRTAAMLAVAAGALALAGCGGDGSQATTATGTDTVMTTTGTSTEATTSPATTQASPPTTTAPKQTTITVVVENGRPRGGIARPTLQKGERVVLVVRTDAGEAVHLHGYDIEKQVTPGRPVRIPFTASVPGRFELELHHPDALLAVLQVRP